MEKELELLELLANHEELSQRELAKSLEISLGTVNHLLQEFEALGYIQVQRLNARNVMYLLTQEGYKQYYQHYIAYISQCFDSIAKMRQLVKKNILFLVKNGYERFYLLGNQDELLRLVKMCFFEISRTNKIEYLNYDESLPISNATTMLVGYEPIEDQHLPYTNLLESLR
ncbi:MAG: winged helix-turn-helix transcriptional regulator [Vallitaleaceae bacterium]|jgi:DNA-binding transcriptional regulator YhcF (GntR family)|nr:winged helix-turn-helix transcriptional regulator [Vallitaleaceae bacterium]